MQIKLWTNFSKRKNSTKQPSDASAVVKDVKFKEDTSLNSPAFILDGIEMQYNYVQAFGYYYFITEIVLITNTLYEIRCEKDYLASYKGNIGSYTGKVIYSSSNYNLHLTDGRIAPSHEVEYKSTTIPLTTMFDTSGCYILGCMGKDANGMGGIATYYVLSLAGLIYVANNIFTNTTFWQQVVNEFTNPMDALISCLWLPISQDSIPGIVGNFSIGSQTLGSFQAKRVSSRIIGKVMDGYSITYPDSATANTYLRQAPYTSGVVFLPFVGCVPYDLDAYYGLEEIQMGLNLDVLTGDLVYNIKRGGIISTYSGNCATALPISAAGFNAVGTLSSVISTIGGVAAGAAGGMASGGVAGAAVGAGGALLAGGAGIAKSLEVHSTISGSNSSALGVYSGTNPVVTLLTRKPAQNITAMASEQGLLCHKTVTISTLSGYVQCYKASINIAGPSTDKDAVNGYMNSGFYYE